MHYCISVLGYIASIAFGNVNICAVEKSPKSEIYAILNLFFRVERSETKKNRFARRRQAAVFRQPFDQSLYLTGGNPYGFDV